MNRVLRESSFSRSPRKEAKKSNETTVDLAIAVYEQYLSNDSQQIQNLNTIMNEIKFPHWNTIIEKIQAIWTKNYLNNIKILNNKGETELHLNKFENEIKKLFSKRNEYLKWEKYFLYVINKEIEDIKSEVFNDGGSTRKRLRRKSEGKSQQQQQSNEIIIELETPKLIYSYELKSMLRCHSVNANPQDETTVVYDAAFEPCILEKGKFTNLCATSGGSIINFIDVATGKVIKRFNESKVYHSTKEKFYRLVWTIIDEKTILAAAGLHGDIKIIIPDQSSCVMRINAHLKQIHSLCFHNRHSSILFSGSEDKTVQIWKIEIEDGNYRFGSLGQIKYIPANNKRTGPEAALTLSMFENYLIISTCLNNYYVELNDDDLFESIDYEDRNKKVYNAKLLKFVFDNKLDDYNTDEFIINRLIWVHGNKLILNLTYSAAVFIFEAIKTPDAIDEDDLKLKYLKMIQIGTKCAQLDPSIELFEDNNSYYVLKATDSGCFYKIELDKTTFDKKTILKFHIPTDYIIKTNNSSTIIPVRTHELLDNFTVINKCATNVDYIVTACQNNLLTIWSKSIIKNKIKVFTLKCY